MTRAVVMLAACLAVLLAVTVADARAVRGRLAAAEARAVAYAEAAQKTARVLAQIKAVADDAAALDQSLQEGEGADAPLSDYLRVGAGRVWQ